MSATSGLALVPLDTTNLCKMEPEYGKAVLPMKGYEKQGESRLPSQSSVSCEFLPLLLVPSLSRWSCRIERPKTGTR